MTIGDGAVIGAGSVIASDVAPYAIVVGNPGHILHYRFDADQIHKLLEIKWWDKDLEELAVIIPLLQSPNGVELIRRYA